MSDLDRDEVLRAHGTRHDVMLLAETMGLRVKGMKDRLKCPFEGCRDKGNEGSASVSVTESSGIARLKCFRCDGFGSAIDLLMIRDHLEFMEALKSLAGQPVNPRPAPATHLRVVPGSEPTDPDKLTPKDVSAAWRSLVEHDELGDGYLAAREISYRHASVVRFTTDKHPDKGVRYYHTKQRRVAMLLTDVLGRTQGIQFRLAREPHGKEPKQLMLKGSSPKGAFFGHPEKVTDSFLVCVTEGMADTLALLGWTEHDKRVDCVVGAAGMKNLSTLAEELEKNSLNVEGIIFALFPQNDRPEHRSRIEFRRLEQLLTQMGAQCIYVETPSEHKDVAEWLRCAPDTAWPPPDLRRALEFKDPPAASTSERPSGQVVPLPKDIRVEFYQQNFTTLCALLDDPVTREAILGPGVLRMHSISHELYLDDRQFGDVDFVSVRLGLERVGKSPEGRPLKFAREDITQALQLVASKRQFNPVADYLKGLQWDQTPRIDAGVSKALGVDPGTLEALFLRRWFIQAVARGLEPGCKADCVLVLVGDQGVGKSTFFDALGGEFFTDSPGRLDDKDSRLILGQKWIIEWAELDAMRRARDHKLINAFITSRVDTFRRPYDRTTVSVPRCCVIVGMTNDEGFLSDPTGSRRFWAVRVRGMADIGWVKENRDQLWAEAVHLYGSGEIHHLEPEYVAPAIEHATEFEESDPWTDMIRDFQKTERGSVMSDFTVSDLLEFAIKKPTGQWTIADQMRVGRVCRTLLKWKKTKGYRNGVRVWVFRPKTAEELKSDEVLAAIMREPGQEG